MAGIRAVQSQFCHHHLPAGVATGVEPSGSEEGPHQQPKGFLHTPFFLTTAGDLVPKKLAVEREEETHKIESSCRV